jgi:hypothetical protein
VLVKHWKWARFSSKCTSEKAQTSRYAVVLTTLKS